MRQDDLIYLFCDGSGKGLYVGERPPANVRLDLGAGTLTQGEFTAKIGEEYRMLEEWRDRRGGILVGVYDRMDRTHLDSMLCVQREFAKDPVSVVFYGR